MTELSRAESEEQHPPTCGDAARIEGPPLNLGNMLWPADYPAQGEPDKAALIFEGRVTTYRQLDRRSSAFVTMMGDLGIKPGQRIAYLGRNSDLYFPVVFGAFRGGVVLVPLNWRCTASELRFIIADAEPKLLLCDPEFIGVATEAAPIGTRIIVTTGTDGLAHILETAIPSAWQPHHPDAISMLMYTSGTTGKPKGVCITQRMYAIARHVEITSPYYDDWEPDEVLLSPMPNFHMGGLSFMLGSFRRGLTCVLTADTTPRGLLALCVEYGVARTFIVPTVVRAMLNEMRAQQITLPKLKQIQYGASPMDVALLQESIDQLGCHFLHHYGMTENAGSATRLGGCDHDANRPHLLRSVGKPQAGLAIEIRGSMGDVLRRREPGEIWIRSPTVTPGYWQRDDATREVLVDDWFRTGDGGYLDDDGFLFLTDRIKDMVVTGGENVYPAEVEEALRLHPSVADCAVFGLPDPRWGEMVAAAVEWLPGSTATASDLVAHLRREIAGYKIPKLFAFDIKLPRTATAKVQRGEVRKLVLARPT